MRVLAIETATACGSVAVVGPDGVLAERTAHVPGGHLEWLLPAVTGLLDDAHISREQIDALTVSIGPGSFIGLRIGVVTAASWAHACGLPLIAISTLEVIAAGVPETGLVLAALDARRGEVAAALFRREGDTHRLTGDLLVEPSSLSAHLGRIAEPVVIAGGALALHTSALLAALAPWAVASDRRRWWPRASVGGMLGRARLLRGERSDPVGLVPRYIQRSIAREFPAPNR
jgi:tRNA threonylcarbamoyladenosine biosynthesis protein TsaB